MSTSRVSVGLKRLIILVLFGVFIAQFYRVSVSKQIIMKEISLTILDLYLKATSKFCDGLLGTVIEYDSSISDIQAPSVSVCPVEKKWLSDTKVSFNI